MKKYASYLLLGLVFLLLAACQGETSSPKGEQAPLDKLVQTENLDWRLNFNKIRLAQAADNFQGGSSLEDLTALFGQSSKHEQNPAGEVTLDSYSWQKDNVTVTVQFFENSAVSRAISNFSFERKASISQKDYEQVTQGMTYSKAIEILGEADLLSESVSSDKQELQAVWISGLKSQEDSPLIELTFENDQLVNKHQVALAAD